MTEHETSKNSDIPKSTLSKQADQSDRSLRTGQTARKSSSKMKAVVATAFVLGLVAVGAQSANADQITTDSAQVTTQAGARENPMANVVSAIAAKFNLSTTDVQAVVDGVMQADHAAMEAKMQAALATRLSAAVTAGKLTQAQADLITAKSAELKATIEADRTADKTLTADQRKAKMEAQKTALETWATANGISKESLQFLAGGRGPGMGAKGNFGGGHKGGHPGGAEGTATSAATAK